MGALFGIGKSGSGTYGRTSPILRPLIPTQVWVWDINSRFKAMYQAGASPLVAINFTHGAKGCGDVSLDFAKAVDIVETDRIKIRLFNSDQYFYTGTIRSKPIAGSTKKGFQYSGFGYNEYFKRINAGTQNFANKTIAYILYSVLSTKLLGGVTPILYDVAKLNPPSITLTSLKANYCQVDEVFDALLKIANSGGIEYNYGVDKDGYFFFGPREETTKAILTVGKRGKYSIQAYEPEDSTEYRTKIILLDKNGTYLNTFTSTLGNEIWEEKVTAPDIDNASAELWARGILAQKERASRSASINWKIEDYYPDVLISDGYLRIISAVPPTKQITVTGTGCGDGPSGDGYCGGSAPVQFSVIDDTLAIKEVKYKITAKSASRSIELGALPVRLDGYITDINKKITSLEVSLGV